MFDIAATADHQPAVYIRWGMGPTDSSNTYPGWNVDDVEIWGTVPPQGFAKGDMNCDGAVDGADIEPFFFASSDPVGSQAAFPGCNLTNADINGDASVDGADIEPFFECLSSGNCP